MLEREHRIKNHLQLVASSLSLQARLVDDPHSRAMLHAACGRMLAVARVHEQLQRLGEFDSVDIGDCLKRVCGDLSACFGPGAGLTLEVEADHEIMSPEAALTVALIANELITNAVKHGDSAHIHVHLGRERRHWRLTVKDNGKGLPANGADSHQGLGARMLESMAQQLGGTLRIDATECGASISVLFQHSHARVRKGHC